MNQIGNMSARIEKDFSLQTAVHYENEFFVNSYLLTLSMLVETDSFREQNIAMDRAAHFIVNVLQNTVLINSKEKAAIEKYKQANIKICELPEDPYDQIFAMVLLLKLNTIMEDRLKITDMVISSIMSGDLRYNIVAEQAESFLNGNYWWNSPDLSINNNNNTNDYDKIIRLFNDDGWSKLGLTWKETVKN